MRARAGGMALGMEILRKLLTLAGALSISAAQFGLTFTLMRRMDLHEFGQIAFLLIVYQFLLGCWGALFCAPLLVSGAGAGDGGEDGVGAVPALNGASLLSAGIVGLSMVLMVRALGVGWPGAWLFALYCAQMLVRQYGRTLGLYRQHRHAVMASDLAFALAVLVAAALCLVRPEVTMGMVCAGLAGAASLSLLVLVLLPGGREMMAIRPDALGDYRAIWQKDARWSLTGVLTTEMSVNAHSYLVTILLGADAFAPIAAAALFIRPILVVLNPLAEFERVHMARHLSGGGERDERLAELRRRRDLMRWTALAMWGLVALGVAAAVGLLPPALLAGHMPSGALAVATALWFAVALVRCLYVPDGALLQAAGHFRLLAAMAGGAAAVSTLLALAACLVLNPVWSIGGILLGEATYALLLSRRARTFLEAGGHG